MEYSTQETPTLCPACFTRAQRDFCFIQLSAIPVPHRQELQFLEEADYYTTNFIKKDSYSCFFQDLFAFLSFSLFRALHEQVLIP